MKFVIVGFGRVGRRVAGVLRSEGHGMRIVEVDPEKAQRARQEGFETIEGDGEDEGVLELAGLDDADAVAGLTGDLNVNFAACMIGKNHDCRAVMRIDEDYREEIYEKYTEDVDEIIYPERLGAAGAKNALLGGDLNVLADLTEQLTATTVDIPPNAPTIGKRVVGIDLPDEARLYAHGRAHEAMTIPLPRTTIQPGDQVAIIADPDALESVKEHLCGERAPDA